MVLNTSFNENKPGVCRPEEALDCFPRTKMDGLVMGDVVMLVDEGRAGSASKYAPAVLANRYSPQKTCLAAQITLHDGGGVRSGRDYALRPVFRTHANAY
jgi:hypothetical protein